MAATREDISGWFERGVAQGYDYMIVVCDTFDWDDYPVFANKDDVMEKHESHAGKNMQKIMEVYDLKMDKNTQMNERRAFHLPQTPAL